MKKWILLVGIVAVISLAVSASIVSAQEAAAPAAPALTEAGGAAPAAPVSTKGPNFFQVVGKSGPLGILLWLALFGAGGAAVYFGVDCGITVRTTRIMPQQLIDAVTEAMAEGDVLKALQSCENEPGPMANILIAGFSHVEEGFDIIQESITTAADLETERIVQKLTWLSVVGNLAPMLGLLGTVQGMIAAFESLGAGSPDVQLLAMNISQALFTTAGGLMIAVPCVAAYYVFRNTANTIILRMEAMTMELIKDLRNVEVVEE